MTDIALKNIRSGYNLSKINSNFDKIEDVINEEVLHTVGGNNTMSQELDMNSNRITNLGAPLSDSDPLRKGDITTDTTGATVQYVDDSIASIDINSEVTEDISVPYTFPSAEAMRNSTLSFPEGKKLVWQGYYTESDGGSNWGVVRSGSHTEDGGLIFTLAGGGYVEANLKGKSVNVLKFGALGDYSGSSGTENSGIIQKVLDYADGTEVRIPKGSYLISESITSYNNSGEVSNGVRISGAGSGATVLVNRVEGLPMFDFNHSVGSTSYNNQVFSTGSYMQHLDIVGSDTVAGSSGVKIQGLYGFNIHACLITRNTLYGLWAATDLDYNPDFTASVRLSITNSSITYNKYGIWAPENQAIPTATLRSTNVDWNGTLGILHASNYFSITQGSISFNGYDYEGDFSPDENFGGLTTPNSSLPSLPASMTIVNCEIDGNKPQQIFDNRSSHTIIRGCKFGVRRLDNENKKYVVVFGADVPASVFSCYQPVFEGNTITVNSGDYSSVDMFIVKFKAGNQGGHVGKNTYFFTGTGLLAGSNLWYVDEDPKTGNNDGGYKGVTCEVQDVDNQYNGVHTQYQTGFVKSLPYESVFSFKPRYNGGTLTVSGGSSFTHAIVGYSVGTGVTWEMAPSSLGVELGSQNQVLTGTTGNDGRLTISAANGYIYVENRLGGTTTVSASTQPTGNMYN